VRLVLASASPRRRRLLPLLGIPFEVVAPEVEELAEGDPLELVRVNAERKARAGAELAGPGAIVIGADTDVALAGRLVGKPTGAAQAAAALRVLSGREHEVHSGVFVLSPDAELGGVESTVVRFRELGGREIDTYVETGEWRGRAGGYAVQGLGSSLIEAIEGDVSNVIGLPMPLLAALIGALPGAASD
jgi:septum formation protein